MQTFLPYEDFQKSAQCLDRQRLGKQRVEAFQILQTLLGKSKGWRNHPAVKMWKGHEGQLWLYGLTICIEWIARGYADSMLKRFSDVKPELDNDSFQRPEWLGKRRFHESHRSNLLRKDKSWYRQFCWTCSSVLSYFWPV